MRRMIAARALLGCVAVLLAACAVPAAPPDVKASSAALSQIKTIVVVAPPGPEQYTAIIGQHPGYSFGAVGAVVAYSDMDSKAVRLTNAMKAQNFSLFSTLAEAVAAKLSAAGYQASVGPGAAPADGSAPKNPGLKPDPDADATLLLTSAGATGFIASTIYNSYIPNLAVTANLVDREAKSIYSGSYRTGSRGTAGEGWKFVRTSGGFANFDVLMQDPTATAAALKATAEAIAALVETDLKR